MRKLTVILFLSLVFVSFISAEVIVKVKGNAGGVAENFVLQTNSSPLLGGSVDVEWKCKGDWTAYWGHPNMGISVGLLNFNNSPYFGTNYRVMPYLIIPFTRDKNFNVGARFGAGVSYFTDISVVNGGHIAPLMEVGLYGELELSRRVSLLAELNMDGINNMALRVPSPSIAVGYGSLGVRMRLGELPKARRRGYKYVADNPINSIWNISMTAGMIDYSTSNNNVVPVASFHADYQWFITNNYATGIGTTINYNGKYTEQGMRGADNHTNPAILNDFYIPEEKASNKFRAGVEWANTFAFGRFSYLVNVGLFLYDPIRNAYTEETNRSLVYSFKPFEEEGFMYARIGFRYRIVQGLALEANVNTFAGIFDNMQFGFNYSIPYTQRFKMKNRSSMSSLKLYKYED